MILSHRYRYLFIQVPRTASSSIGIELCKNYAGEPILHKHCCYDEFLEQAGPEEREYFVFAGVRNPLDSLVTEYFRRKAGERTKENVLHLEKYVFIRDKEASFPEFVKRFHYHFHKTDRSFYRGVDFVYKYENLQEDFSRVLEKLGIEQKRLLPQFNMSTGKTEPFLSYYTEEIQPIVRIVMNGRMKQTGYEFPEDWQTSTAKMPYILMTALVGTIAFAAKIMKMRRRGSVKHGLHDSYTQRLRKTYVKDDDSGIDSDTT